MKLKHVLITASLCITFSNQNFTYGDSPSGEIDQPTPVSRPEGAPRGIIVRENAQRTIEIYQANLSAAVRNEADAEIAVLKNVTSENLLSTNLNTDLTNGKNEVAKEIGGEIDGETSTQAYYYYYYPYWGYTYFSYTNYGWNNYGYSYHTCNYYPSYRWYYSGYWYSYYY